MNAIKLVVKNKILLDALLIFFLLVTTSHAYKHTALLNIENKSQRHMTIKVMKKVNKVDSTRYVTKGINKNDNITVNVSSTGSYFLKTKAVLKNKKTIYKKGNPFDVYVGSDGYSVLTITFSITEQEESIANPLSGKTISESEFEQNSTFNVANDKKLEHAPDLPINIDPSEIDKVLESLDLSSMDDIE